MQALGSYKGGKMLFLGLGTGLGSTMIVDGIVAPMELGHLPYKKGTYEDYVGRSGLKRYGKKKWRRHVADVAARGGKSVRSRTPALVQNDGVEHSEGQMARWATRYGKPSKISRG